MKNKLLSILFLLLVFEANSQPETIWQLLNNGGIIRWAYSGGDEFNGTALDESKWYQHYPWGNTLIGNKEIQYYSGTNSNLIVDNGILKLITKYEPGYHLAVSYLPEDEILADGIENKRFFSYSSAMICSKQQFKYGLFEIKCKIPEGKGLWPAFWLYGGNPNEEFDIFECKGERTNQLHWNVHDTPKPNVGGGGWATVSGSLASSYNDFMGTWEPVMMTWTFNGQEYQYWLGSLDYQAHLIANTAVAGQCTGSNNPAFCPGPDASTPTVSVFEIDFIRVYTRFYCEKVINISNYNQTLLDPTVLTGKEITMGAGTSAVVNNGQFLELIATDYVKLKPSFKSEIGSTFTAKIVDCPGPGKPDSPVGESDVPSSGLTVLNANDTTQLLSVHSDSLPVLSTKIYPNPTQGQINIEFVGKIQTNIKITLTNSSGQEVFSQENIKENKIDINISNLPKGVYYLTGVFGTSVITDKVVLN